MIPNKAMTLKEYKPEQNSKTFLMTGLALFAEQQEISLKKWENNSYLSLLDKCMQVGIIDSKPVYVFKVDI